MDLTWSAAEATAEAAVTEDDMAGFEPGPPGVPDPPFPPPPPPPPPPVDSVSEPPPEYGPEPDTSPKFSVMVTVLKSQS